MAVAVAAQDPIQQLYARWGEAVAQAKHRTTLLEDSFRELEKISSQLADYDLTAGGSLGPVGDCARAAWTDMQEPENALPAFVMPRAETVA